MNILEGEIKNIESNDDLSLVTVLVGSYTFEVIVIESEGSAPYLSKGHPVKLLFKETEVIITSDFESKISIINQIPAKLTAVECGKLLCQLTLESEVGEILAVVSANSYRSLGLKEGENLRAMVKMNEIMLSV